MKKQILANKRNTIIIMAGFIAFISLMGVLFAKFSGTWSIFYSTVAIAIFYTLLQYFLSSRLAVFMTGARPISRQENPRLFNIVEKLANNAGIPLPKIYVINDSAPNAFAAGRNPEHALVAATTGLLDIMDDRELAAVMAHELSHIKNYDIRVSMITFGLVCIVGFISDLGLRMLFLGNLDDDDRSPVGFLILVITSILAPLAASLGQLAISREREYLADMSAAELLNRPEDMIAALKKLDSHSRPMRRQNAATEALFINNPLRKGLFGRLFSTHPPIESRIERLEHAKKNF